MITLCVILMFAMNNSARYNASWAPVSIGCCDLIKCNARNRKLDWLRTSSCRICGDVGYLPECVQISVIPAIAR